MILPSSPSGRNHPIPLPLYSQQIPKRHPFTKPTVETSFPIFDNDVLRSRKREVGGFPYGIISSVSGGNSCGKTLIAMHAITSHLLANPESHVAWVDTDGSFSVQRLLEVVALRLSQQQQQQQQIETNISRQELLKQAGKVLDRVQITKAFDIDAVMQSLEEIKINMQNWEKEKEEKEEEARKEKLKVIRCSVDSEDEIAEDEQDGKDAEATNEDNDNEVGEVNGEAVMDGRIGVLVIDTMSTLSERVRLKKQIAADSILTTFSRSTALLAKNWSIAVLLLDNPPISNTQLPQQQHGYQPSKSTSASVFAEIKQSPSLGPILDFAVDLKVMLSYFDGLLDGGQEAQQGRQQRRRGAEPIIFEVVSDRQGSRRGNWVVYTVKQDGYEIVEFPWPQKEQRPPAKMRSAFRRGLE